MARVLCVDVWRPAAAAGGTMEPGGFSHKRATS